MNVEFTPWHIVTHLKSGENVAEEMGGKGRVTVVLPILTTLK